MKSINFSLGNDGISAISRALSVLPAYDFFDSFPPNLVSMPASIIMKLNINKLQPSLSAVFDSE